MDERERRLEDEIDDLAETLEDLRGELDGPSRGPLGLPRPPTPREFLRLTEGYAIPATISLLETTIRTLELLAAAIRVADGRPLDGEPPDRRGADTARTDRVAAASRRTLAKLDDALADLQSAAAGGDPSNPELQRLLAEARNLRAEVDDRLAEATGTEPAGPSGPEPVDIEVEAGDDGGDERGGGDSGDGGDDEVSVDDVGGRDTGHPGVDVDSELESIKRELDDDAIPGDESEAAPDDESPTSENTDRESDGAIDPNRDDDDEADRDDGGDDGTDSSSAG